MKTPVLHSGHLTLKPITMDFCTTQYVSWMNDSEVNAYLETGGDYTIEKLKEYITIVERNGILFWAITVTASEKHIGNIKIDPIDIEKGSGEYGILMGDKTEWQKGYALEASETVIDYCFNQLHLHRITLGVIENNIPAVKLYDKLGFVVEQRNEYHGKHADKFTHALRMAMINKNV